MALLFASCGYVGRDLLAHPDRDGEVSVPADGGSDPGRNDGGADLDAQLPPRDAAEPRDAASDASRDASGDANAAFGDAQADGGVADGGATDASVDSAVDAGPAACDLSGTYAVKVSVTVSWPGGGTEAGSGGAAIWLRLDVTQSGNTMSGTLLPCGFALPDFSLPVALGAETYGMRFQDSLFDTVPPFLNTIPAAFTITGASVPGATLSLAQTGLVVGATLANPATDPWPANSALTNLDDTEGDTKPGVTAIYLNDATHVYPRLNFTGSQRSDRAYAAARFAFSAAGTIDTCSDIGGAATVQHFDTHVRGCHIAGGADCSTTQRDLLDSNRPVYMPDSATYRALRIITGSTCTQVRAANP